ncbi:MAG: hypothetical protein SGPRY_003814 [Prymnesium sp.]
MITGSGRQRGSRNSPWPSASKVVPSENEWSRLQNPYDVPGISGLKKHLLPLRAKKLADQPSFLPPRDADRRVNPARTAESNQRASMPGARNKNPRPNVGRCGSQRLKQRLYLAEAPSTSRNTRTRMPPRANFTAGFASVPIGMNSESTSSSMITLILQAAFIEQPAPRTTPAAGRRLAGPRRDARRLCVAFHRAHATDGTFPATHGDSATPCGNTACPGYESQEWTRVPGGRGGRGASVSVVTFAVPAESFRRQARRDAAARQGGRVHSGVLYETHLKREENGLRALEIRLAQCEHACRCRGPHSAQTGQVTPSLGSDHFKAIPCF